MAPGLVLTAPLDCPSPTRDSDAEQRGGGPLGCSDLPGTDKLPWDGVGVGTEAACAPWSSGLQGLAGLGGR